MMDREETMRLYPHAVRMRCVTEWYGRDAWYRENMRGRVIMQGPHLLFELEEDAVLFRMVWR
jgi:hypothetical protein